MTETSPSILCFVERDLDGFTPAQVADGLVFGHLLSWAEFPHLRGLDYANLHVHQVTADNGHQLDVCHMIDPHDETRVLADILVVEDNYGLAVRGAARPGVPDGHLAIAGLHPDGGAIVAITLPPPL